MAILYTIVTFCECVYCVYCVYGEGGGDDPGPNAVMPTLVLISRKQQTQYNQQDTKIKLHAFHKLQLYLNF